MSKNLFLSVSLAVASVSGVVSAQVREGSWTPAIDSVDRGYSSISYWTNRDDGVEIGGGRISVEHGKPSWHSELDAPERFDAATIGKLWRLGNNKWTTLDTNLALHFGDRRVEPGIYYLFLQRPNADTWRLAFISPAAVMPRLMDAWDSVPRPQDIPILFSVPLRYTRGEKKDVLDITLGLDDADMAKGSIRIEWGPHRLETGMNIEMVSPTFYRDAKKAR